MTRRYPYQFIDFNQPLVDPETGRISPYFQRQLFGQTENAQEVSDEVDAFAAAITALQNEKADKDTLISPGFGLSGGGDLSQNRSLSLGNPALVDPNGDRILFWDESLNQLRWLNVGTNLTITDDTISASGGGGGGGGEYVVPTALALPDTYGSPGLVDFHSTGLTIGDVANGSGVSGRGVNVSGDATIIAYVEGLTDVNFNSIGVFITDGTRYSTLSGVQVFGYLRVVELWANRTTFSSQFANRTFGGGNVGNWLRIAYSAGTGLATFFFGYDGKNWIQIGGTSNWIGPLTAAGVFVNRNNTTISPQAFIRSFQVV